MSHENLLSFPGYIFSDKTTCHKVMTENRGTCAWLYQPLTDERCKRHFIKAKCQECTGTGMARQLYKTFQSSRVGGGGGGGTCLFSSTCHTPPIINISRDQTLNLWCCANTGQSRHFYCPRFQRGQTFFFFSSLSSKEPGTAKHVSRVRSSTEPHRCQHPRVMTTKAVIDHSSSDRQT